MKKYYLLIILLSFVSMSDAEEVIIMNPHKTPYIDAQFTVERSQLNPKDDLLPVLISEKGDTIPSQVDDMNGDGKWDELIFVLDAAPNQKRILQIAWVQPGKYPSFTPRTNIRYGRLTKPGHIAEFQTDMHDKYHLGRGGDAQHPYPYQTDGPSWENDKMGFRHYFDGRNCRDVFGKKVSWMAMDSTGIKDDGNPGDTYHVMRTWGRDIMSAANSFGLGGIGLLKGDSLIRLGVLIDSKTDNVDSTRFTIMNEGPVRSMFRLDFYGWDIGGEKINLTDTVTIWAGCYGYENRIGTSKLPIASCLVTGVVTNNNDAPYRLQRYPDGTVSMNTHDKQTYDKVWYMGMSVIIPPRNYDATFEASDMCSDIKDTWCVRLNLDQKNTYVYDVCAAWEIGDSRFTDRNFYFNMVDQYVNRLTNPLPLYINLLNK